MTMLDLGDLQLHWREDGDPSGAPIVFAHALGTDLSLWDAIIERLPPGLRVIRYDLRGHGQSSCPPAPYAMGALIRDAERLLDHLSVRDAIFVGVSLGGMIGQGLAVKRLDLVRGLVLSNTAVKIGTAESWAKRIEEVRRRGLEGIVEGVLERWFPKRIRRGLDLSPLRATLLSTPTEGYIGCCQAVSGTDFYTPTAGLRLPVLVIAGSDDGATPPDLVRETATLIPGAEFQLIRGAGHLPMIDQSAVFADRIGDFLTRLAPSACGAPHDTGEHRGHALSPHLGRMRPQGHAAGDGDRDVADRAQRQAAVSDCGQPGHVHGPSCHQI